MFKEGELQLLGSYLQSYDATIVIYLFWPHWMARIPDLRPIFFTSTLPKVCTLPSRGCRAAADAAAKTSKAAVIIFALPPAMFVSESEWVDGRKRGPLFIPRHNIASPCPETAHWLPDLRRGLFANINRGLQAYAILPQDNAGLRVQGDGGIRQSKAQQQRK